MNKQIKQLGENFIALVTLKILNYFLPLLLIPYLIRILGIDGFGTYAFVYAIMMYITRLSDYGFELSGTYHVSKYRNDTHKLNEIFSSLLVVKVVISIILILLLTLLTFAVPKLYEQKELIWMAYGIVIGNIMFPLWFFQGIEKMRYILYLNAFSKILFVLLTFIFIKEKSDVFYLFLFNSFSFLLIGIVALYIAIKKFNIKLYLPSIEILFFYIKDGWYIFTSKIAVEFYIGVNTIFLGMLTSPTIVGYYAITEKIIHTLGNLLEPVTKSVYPYFVTLYEESKEKYIKQNKQLSLFILLFMSVVTFILYTFSDKILLLIVGYAPEDAQIHMLQSLSLVLIVYLFGTQFTNILVINKETKFLNRVLFSAAIINTILAPILISYYSSMGLIWLNVFIAYFITLWKGYYIYIRDVKEMK